MVAIVQSAHYSTGAGVFTSTATATFGASPIAGNILLAVCSWDKNCGGTITIPSGFTEIGTQVNNQPSVALALAYKISNGTETSFTSTIPGTINTSGLTVFELSGLDPAGVVEAVQILYTDDANVSSRATPTLASNTQFACALAIFESDTIHNVTDGTGQAWTNGFTTLYTAPNAPNSGQVGFVLAAKSFTSAQASINSTFSYTGGAADQAMSALIVFKETTPPANAVKSGRADFPTTSSVDMVFELTSSASDAYVDLLDYASGTILQTSTPGSVDGQNFGKATFNGLTANTRYKWRVGTTSLGQDTAFTGSFYTAHNAGTSITYDLLFLNDWQPNNNDYTAFTRVAAVVAANRVNGVISVGDFPYTDIGTADSASIQAKWRTMYNSTINRGVFDNAAYEYIWDDHDFGTNDCDSTVGSAATVKTEYDRFIPFRSHPVSGTKAHSFVQGQIRHIMMDLRSERINYSQIISTTQLAWIKAELLAARDAQQVVILYSSSPWNVLTSQSGAQPDTWAPYQTTRAAIMDYAQSLSMQNSVCVIHADAHMLAGDNGTNTRYSTDASFGWNCFCCAAMSSGGSTKGGPFSDGSLAGTDQYARFTVTENGTTTVSIRVRLVQPNDANFLDRTFTLTAAPLPLVATIVTHNDRLLNNGALAPYVGTTSPSNISDFAHGFTPGQIWINTSTPAMFICISNANGAAVWRTVTTT